jgi:hypothetical protein
LEVIDMSQGINRFVFWAPRILCIIFAILISALALDVFGEGYGFWKTIAALLIHLIPTYIVIAVLLVSWRWECVGAVLFTALAVLYVFMAWGAFPFVTYVTISGPLLLVGILFYVNWISKRRLRKSEN